jgi:UDP-N-acetylmuramate--alanine ligase
LPPEGLLVGCGDQPAVIELFQKTRAREDVSPTIWSCGLGENNDWQASQVRTNSLGGHDFDVLAAGSLEQGQVGDGIWGTVHLGAPGQHNVQNALLALAIADWLGIDRDTIIKALSTYPGVERRFEVRTASTGRSAALSGGKRRVVVDDYGHHPTEIRATLAAARARYGARPLWAIFQPHTYSRLRTLWKDFGESFVDADHVIVLDVYAAREKDPLGGAAASGLASALANEMVHRDARHIGDAQAAAEYIVSQAEPDAVVITLSAGDGNQVGTLVLEQWDAETYSGQ